MTRNTALIVIATLALGMTAASLWAYGALADPAAVPIRLGLTGEAEAYGSAARAFSIMPAVSLLMLIVLWAVPHIDPRGRHIAQSEKAVSRIFVIVVEFFTFAHVVMIATALTWIPTEWTARLILAGAAVLLGLMGNLLGKVRSNFFIGFRTPWTLSSEYSWEKTHRLAGRLFVLTGATGVLGAAFAPLPVFAGVFGAWVVVAVLVPLVMSFVWWRDDPGRHGGDAPDTETSRS